MILIRFRSILQKLLTWPLTLATSFDTVTAPCNTWMVHRWGRLQGQLSEFAVPASCSNQFIIQRSRTNTTRLYMNYKLNTATMKVKPRLSPKNPVQNCLVLDSFFPLNHNSYILGEREREREYNKTNHLSPHLSTPSTSTSVNVGKLLPLENLWLLEINQWLLVNCLSVKLLVWLDASEFFTKLLNTPEGTTLS